MIARVRGVISRAPASGSKFKSILTSANLGVAPASAMQLALARNELDAVMTSSPGPIPMALSARMSASVPELTPTACLLPHKAANSFSNKSVCSPRMNCPESITPATAVRISFRSGRCCRVRFMYGMRMTISSSERPGKCQIRNVNGTRPFGKLGGQFCGAPDDFGDGDEQIACRGIKCLRQCCRTGGWAIRVRYPDGRREEFQSRFTDARDNFRREPAVHCIVIRDQ